MRISWSRVLVEDQEKALTFYAGVLGFVRMAVNMGLITAVVCEDTCGNLINLLQPMPMTPAP